MAPLSEAEMKLLLIAFETAKTPIQVDYEAIAKKAGYSSKNTASVMWLRLKKKIEAGSTSAGVSATSTLTKKRGRTPKAGKDGSNIADDDDDEAAPTPAKRARGQKTMKKPKKAVKDEAEDEDGLEEDKEVIVKGEELD